MMTHLTRAPISVESLLAAVQSSERGGTCVFLGSVRDDDDVTGIEYSVYDDMALAEITRMLDEARGRWPEARAAPKPWFSALVAFLTSAASMIAFINSIVAGTGVTLLANSVVGRDQIRLALGLGVLATVVLMTIFLAYQRRRYRDAEAAASREEPEPRR